MEIPNLTFEPTPLSKEASEQIMTMLMVVNSGKEVALEQSSLNQEFLAQVLLKRIKAYKLPFTFTDMFFLASVLTFVDVPGKVMALLRICWQHWKKSGKTEFNLFCWCSELFPHGVPSDSDLQSWWDSQKDNNAPLGNLVDRSDLW
jgi:hypothetical protein